MSGLRVLLLGGTGVISGACARAAVAAGHHVTMITRGVSEHDVPEGAVQRTADVRDANSLYAAVGDEFFDVVADFLSYVPDHVDTVLSVCEGRTHQYIFVGTASAYQKPPQHLPVTEDTPLDNPFWQYSRDKIACEDILQAAARERSLPVTVVRPSHTYDHTRVPTLGGWTDIARMRAGKPVIIHGDGTTQWTITHADDFAVAFTGLFGEPRAIGESFTITGTHAPTWNQIYQWLADAAGVESPECVHIASDAIAQWAPDLGPRLLGDKTYSGVFDNSKVSSLVPEFATTVMFEEGARRILTHFDAHPELQVEDPHLDRLFDSMAAHEHTVPLRVMVPAIAG